MKYLAAIGLATLAALSGCTDRLCSDIGFRQGLNFVIDSGPAAADYQVQVEHEGGLLLLDYSVQADGKVRCVEDCSDLDDALRIGPAMFENAEYFTSQRVTLGILGTPEWSDLPTEVHVKIFRDAALVHDQVYAPMYEHSESWGEGCGEGIQAGYDVTLPR